MFAKQLITEATMRSADQAQALELVWSLKLIFEESFYRARCTISGGSKAIIFKLDSLMLIIIIVKFSKVKIILEH